MASRSEDYFLSPSGLWIKIRSVTDLSSNTLDTQMRTA